MDGQGALGEIAPSGDAAGGPDPALLDALRRSCLFDPAFYARQDGAVRRDPEDALRHWHAEGWRLAWRPNFYFDTTWYLETNPDVRLAAIDPLLHYVLAGEREGRRPCLIFDPGWYRSCHAVGAGELALAHFLRHRCDGTARGIELFDPAFYLGAYADIAASGMDPLEHYLVQGFREGRRPFEGFDPFFYRDRYLRDFQGANPLLHYLGPGRANDARIARPADETTVAREVRRFTRPGPGFEERLPVSASAPRRARLLAFYLPQFHPIPENDRWWGDGFTEWTSVSRGLPRFGGHWQPRVPRDLGHYRLDRDAAPEVLRRQIALARDAAIEGFVFYFYWFNGRRLLDGPLEALLADPSLDVPFCLMWANENWSRRWDGSEDDVLIRQDYRAEDEDALLAEWARHMRDRRSIRIDGRPLLMVYRAGLIPDTRATVGRWRQRLAALLPDMAPPFFVMAQSFGDADPLLSGFDAAVEFPPHKICDDMAAINPSLDILDTDFCGRVLDYGAVAAAALAQPRAAFPVIRTVVPSWDNDARRQGAGIVLHGATPALYEDWLRRTIDRAVAEPVAGDAVVCINAWNEWAEGAHLEPDQHWGSAFLNATGRAATAARCPLAAVPRPLLLVGHDGLRHGAQLLLLAVARRLRERHGVPLRILLGGDGPLVPLFEALGPTAIAATASARDEALDRLGAVDGALVNSLASADAVGAIRARGVRVVLLAHEMPRLLREKNLLGAAAPALEAADLVVVAAVEVRRSLETLVPALASDGRVAVLPQGVERIAGFSPEVRAAERRRLGIGAAARVALGVGYADLRKGFDLFLAAFRALHQAGADIHFVWAGAIDPTVADYLADEIDAATATGRFRMTGYLDRTDGLYDAADALLLTSREDPFPSVALEAMAAGLPVVAFDRSGGIPALLRRARAGAVVAPGDGPGLAAAFLREAERGRGTRRRDREARRLGAVLPSLDRYAATLLGLGRPALLDVSVVVPAWNSAATLDERLETVFGQTLPVREVVVLDDASADDTVARAAAAAERCGRHIALHRNGRNSGSPFRQWREAARRATGTWLWIAEADDAADPTFLEALAEPLRRTPRAVLGFTDSRAVDEAGRLLHPTYRDYARESGCTVLDADAAMDGPDFLRSCLAERNLVLNASAVLFRRDALLRALDACEAALDTLRVAGDWLLYATMLRERDSAVVYVSAALNVHRRHAASATARLAAGRHLTEVAEVQDLISRMPAAIGPADRKRQLRYRRTLRARLGLRPATRRTARR